MIVTLSGKCQETRDLHQKLFLYQVKRISLRELAQLQWRFTAVSKNWYRYEAFSNQCYQRTSLFDQVSQTTCDGPKDCYHLNQNTRPFLLLSKGFQTRHVTIIKRQCKADCHNI